MTNLKQLYAEMAQLCIEQGVALDDSPNGEIHQWVLANVKHRTETVFFIVFGIACAMADLKQTNPSETSSLKTLSGNPIRSAVTSAENNSKKVRSSYCIQRRNSDNGCIGRNKPFPQPKEPRHDHY